MRSLPPVDDAIKIAESMPDVFISPGRPKLAEKMAGTFFNPSAMTLTRDNFDASRDLDNVPTFQHDISAHSKTLVTERSPSHDISAAGITMKSELRPLNAVKTDERKD